MSTIVPSFKGGLGNILFELAGAYGIAKSIGYKMIINLNSYNKSHHSSINYFDSLFKKWRVFHRNTINISNILYEKNLYPIAQIPSNGVTYIDGYLQNYEYFHSFRDQILELLSFDYSVMSKYDKLVESAFIHVRGGDYIGNSTNFVDLTSYYPKAIEAVNAVHYYIFTNDIDFLRKQEWLNTINFTIVNENEIDSLLLMKECKTGAICANSSYSWWGAYLNAERPITMPSKWFGNDSFYTKGYYFPEVIIIPV